MNKHIEQVFQNRSLVVSGVFLISVTIFMTILGIWSVAGTLEESITGHGQMVPDGHLRRVMSENGGRLIRVAVQEGEHVKKGQVLFEIDPESVAIDESAIETQLTQYRLQAASLRKALSKKESQADHSEFGVLQDEWADSVQASLSAEVASSKLEADQRAAEYQESIARQHHLQSLVDSSEAMLKDYRALYDKGGLSRNELMTFEQKVTDQQGQLQTAVEEVQARKLAMKAASYKPKTLQSNYQNNLLRQLSETEQKIASLQANLEKANASRSRQNIVAPISGIVHQMAIHGDGEVVQVGENLTTIVPENPNYIAEVKVNNQDLAYVHPGQLAELTIEALPYQKFGHLKGHVIAISPATVTDAEGHVFYLIKIQPERKQLLYDGKQYALRPGMTLRVSLLTRKRSILSYFTEPAFSHIDAAFREPSNR